MRIENERREINENLKNFLNFFFKFQDTVVYLYLGQAKMIDCERFIISELAYLGLPKVDAPRFF